ncbi:MAG: metal ABC transporter ATP-binding protein [Clostridiales Family XIII bacterium]|jgi:zinc transport system ATP-binding protein|nr:metal ABC transporter ATP-binding protein [Clostridiales Family XIII bacterium]
MEAAPKELLRCEGLSLRYEAAAGYAVQGVDLSVCEGDFLCIVGENGSGKTTLLKMIAGLVQPTEGRVLYTGLRPSEVGYLPQQTAVQKDFPATVTEVAMSGLLNRKGFPPFYTKKDRETARAHLERFGVWDLHRASYQMLSGGQQQRVLLARALCASEKLLLLDEPVAGLDPHAAAGLYEILGALHESGMAVLMVSHDLDGAFRSQAKILHMATAPLYYGDVAGYGEFAKAGKGGFHV